VNTLEYYGTPESVAPTQLAFGTLQVREAPSVQHQEAVGSFFVALRITRGSTGSVAYSSRRWRWCSMKRAP
jgi:hypothetical protein